MVAGLNRRCMISIFPERSLLEFKQLFTKLLKSGNVS